MARALVDDREVKNHPLWAEDDLAMTNLPGTFLVEGYKPEVQRLTVGDIRLELEDLSWLVIELKSITDFLGTLRDNGADRSDTRIRHQVNGLLSLKTLGQTPAMMIIGQYRVDGNKIRVGEGRRSRTHNAKWTEIETAITALEHLGIIVMRCPTMEEVPHASALLAKTVGQTTHFSDHGLAPVAYVSPRLGALATNFTAIDGVGQHLAIDIAERFRTFPRFYTASVEDLAEVKGVGKVMARRIVDHFHDDTDTISDPFNPEFNPFK